MTPENKGIYPNWVGENDIINQVLNEIIKEGGRLPYTYVVNPGHNAAAQQRMKAVLEKMRKEKLIHSHLAGDDFLEIDIEGSRAAHSGYQKYKRIKRWDFLLHRMSRVSVIVVGLAILVLLGYLAYLLLHFLKVV
jgi:hypothetical protein